MRILDLKRADTICALATPFGVSALAIIRVSGNKSDEIRSNIFYKKKNKIKQKYFEATLGYIKINKQLIDEIICIAYPDKKSYTGESSFELYLHGTPITIKRILQILIDYGCRMAIPGEFSLRSVLTEKQTLTKVEAIGDLIHSKSILANKNAINQIKKDMSYLVNPIKYKILSILSLFESSIEEINKEKINRIFLLEKLNEIEKNLEYILLKIKLKKNEDDIVQIIIWGLPNAGKSTLLNRLNDKNCAIVHETEGTTRDILETKIYIAGIEIKLIDVAGFKRKGKNNIENIGIKNALVELKKSDMILWVKNLCSKDLNKYDILPYNLRVPIIKIYTKIDIYPKIKYLDKLFHNNYISGIIQVNQRSILISAKKNIGIHQIRNIIYKKVSNILNKKKNLLICKWHQKKELIHTYRFIQISKKILKEKVGYDVMIFELNMGLASLNRILGKNTGEEVLDEVFKSFCIGK